MNLTQRIANGPVERRMPNNIIPLHERRAGMPRRPKARWLEYQEQQKAGKDLTGYVSGDAA